MAGCWGVPMPPTSAVVAVASLVNAINAMDATGIPPRGRFYWPIYSRARQNNEIPAAAASVN